MAKRNTVPTFLPCVATHYRNVAKTMLKRVTEVRSDMVEKYHGSLVPEIIESLDRLEAQVTETMLLLDAKASKPEFTAINDSQES